MRILSDVPGRALAIFAHPDDLEVSCGGTLAGWTAAGARVALVTCTRGDKGSLDPTTDPEELADRRAAEARASGLVLGAAGVEMLGYDDGEIENTSFLRGQLVELIRRWRPDVVVAPDPAALIFGDAYVNHHDHRAVGLAVLDACAPAAWSPLYYPGAGPPHAVRQVLLSGTLEPDGWVDISATVQRKAEALRCHMSQVGDNAAAVTGLVQRRAAAEGVRAGVASAESYRCLLLRP